jgi:ABC-type branched-subunit amino acid transport system ATPase component
MMPEEKDKFILDIKDVRFAYGGAWALDGCTFTISRGLVTGLIGPNGAGKSTLIEVLSGFLTPHGGAIKFEGVDIAGSGPVKAARMGIVRTFQIPRVLTRLPVIENVMVAAQNQIGENPLKAMFWHRAWARQEAELRKEAVELVHWVGLHAHLDSPAGSLSGGQLRLLEIARALMAHPKVLLLDEPTAGVFPETSRLIGERVREIANQGVSVLVIAHNMGFLASLADDVVVMSQGKVLTRGTLESVRDNEEVKAAYLGLASHGQREIRSHSQGEG